MLQLGKNNFNYMLPLKALLPEDRAKHSVVCVAILIAHRVCESLVWVFINSGLLMCLSLHNYVCVCCKYHIAADLFRHFISGIITPAVTAAAKMYLKWVNLRCIYTKLHCLKISAAVYKLTCLEKLGLLKYNKNLHLWFGNLSVLQVSNSTFAYMRGGQP